MTTEARLKVVVVGSGLAGLTAASILREHHDVTVYERGEESVATGGQGIIIASNAVKILQSLGCDGQRAGAVDIHGLKMLDKHGNQLEDIPLDLKRFGADSWALKRSDFRAELLRIATMPLTRDGKAVEPAKVVFNTPVVGLDPEEGILTLSDGSKVGADVVVVADGIHSRLRDAVVGDDSHKARKTGLTCYRVAISTEAARKALHPEPLLPWWEPETNNHRSVMLRAGDGTPRLVTAYPIRGYEMFNLSIILPTEVSTKATTESWHVDGDVDKMIEAVGDFYEPLRKILATATEVKIWELQDLEPLPVWSRGRAMVIGDAAHAMTPMQGQGANMSIEDAEAFRLLVPGTTREDVPVILQRAESVRRPRTANVLAKTRETHGNLSVVERFNKNLDYFCGYSGIFAELDKLEKEGKSDR